MVFKKSTSSHKCNSLRPSYVFFWRRTFPNYIRNWWKCVFTAYRLGNSINLRAADMVGSRVSIFVIGENLSVSSRLKIDKQQIRHRGPVFRFFATPRQSIRLGGLPDGHATSLRCAAHRIAIRYGSRTYGSTQPPYNTWLKSDSTADGWYPNTVGRRLARIRARESVKAVSGPCERKEKRTEQNRRKRKRKKIRKMNSVADDDVNVYLM